MVCPKCGKPEYEHTTASGCPPGSGIVQTCGCPDCAALRMELAEHHRLHAELDRILHPGGDGPKRPSLCDLVAFVDSDRRALRAENDKMRHALMEQEGREAALECDGAKAVKLLLDDARAEVERLRGRNREIHYEWEMACERDRASIARAETAERIIARLESEECVKAGADAIRLAHGPREWMCSWAEMEDVWREPYLRESARAIRAALDKAREGE